ncbi:MAG: hypothetical protein COA94_00165 [Rickettsiales bacterium]|nr:MAG: hypothetical protein COA94_00165 [Rickettsiales bacterium]
MSRGIFATTKGSVSADQVRATIEKFSQGKEHYIGGFHEALRSCFDSKNIDIITSAFRNEKTVSVQCGSEVWLLEMAPPPPLYPPGSENNPIASHVTMPALESLIANFARNSTLQALGFEKAMEDYFNVSDLQNIISILLNGNDVYIICARGRILQLTEENLSPPRHLLEEPVAVEELTDSPDSPGSPDFSDFSDSAKYLGGESDFVF